MPRETQNKILRVLTDQNFTRVGGSARVYVDLRIISSSKPRSRRGDPGGAASVRISITARGCSCCCAAPQGPARRHPRADRSLHESALHANGIPKRRIADDALAVLQAHDWPGNVRQLRNNIERLMIMVTGNEAVTAEMLPSDIGSGIPPLPTGMGGEKLLTLPLREAREIFEKEYLMAQISRLGGNISRTAEFIGMERSALHGNSNKSLGVG